MKHFILLIKTFMLMLFGKAYADTSTAVVNGEGAVKFTEGVRMVYSKEIEFKALPIMRFAQFATEKTELGIEAGLTISMLTYDNLKLGGALTEMKKMSTQALSGSLKQITVQEHGNAVSNSELLIQSSFDDVMATTTSLLSRDYAMTLDCELRDTALSGKNIVFARTSSGQKVTGRGNLDETCTFKVSTVKDAIEVLATNNAPKYGNMNWICFVHPHQSRDLRDDSAWINASNYGDPSLLFNGEIGRIDDTRFIETTLMCNGAVGEDDPAFKPYLKKGFAGDSTNPKLEKTNVYQSVVFGDQYYGLAWSLPVELRTNGVEDFGRVRSLAWYAIWGTGLLNKDYGVVIETA